MLWRSGTWNFTIWRCLTSSWNGGIQVPCWVEKARDEPFLVKKKGTNLDPKYGVLGKGILQNSPPSKSTTTARSRSKGGSVSQTCTPAPWNITCSVQKREHFLKGHCDGFFNHQFFRCENVSFREVDTCNKLLKVLCFSNPRALTCIYFLRRFLSYYSIFRSNIGKIMQEICICWIFFALQTPLDPKTMKNEGFRSPNIWVIVITPKNEGCGFPWHVWIPRDFSTRSHNVKVGFFSVAHQVALPESLRNVSSTAAPQRLGQSFTAQGWWFQPIKTYCPKWWVFHGKVWYNPNKNHQLKQKNALSWVVSSNYQHPPRGVVCPPRAKGLFSGTPTPIHVTHQGVQVK